MTIDPTVIPGLVVLAAEFVTLAGVGYVVVRTVLRQTDERAALAQGLVVGLSLWGVIVNFVMYVVPGLAGSAVGWSITVALGSFLAWRARRQLRPQVLAVAGFAATAVVLFWAALASRQLITITDPYIVLGMAASLQAGGFPPALPWGPEMPASYPYGAGLLIGLLAPPVGPDLALVNELLSAYAWTCMVLVVVTALLRRKSWTAALALGPLLLSHGLWTLHIWDAGVLQLPLPTGLPEAGLRTSLGEIYWPAVELSPALRLPEVLADIWKPAFLLAYALAYVVLERAARLERWSWLASLTLAGMVGFLGLLSSTLVPAVVLVWAGLAVMHFMRTRRAGSAVAAALRSGVGPVLAGLLLLGAGGAFTAILSGVSSPGLTVTEGLSSKHWQALGMFDARPGGVGLLDAGPLAVAAVAVALARRDRLVVALAAGAGLLAMAWLVLEYPPMRWDLNRFAGHARNLALVALLLALTTRLAEIRPSRRRFTIALVALLVTWPTVVAPVRSLGLALGNGVQLANAAWVQQQALEQGEAAPGRRFPLPAMSDRLADYIREHTPVDARVFAGEGSGWVVSLSTGRPNGAGFAGVVHQIYRVGPEYLDVRNFLEPAAMRRLGLEYVYATGEWVDQLPDRAARWLADPGLFEPMIRDGAEVLYRVRPAFLQLEVPPHPASFEALRQAVPPSMVVYLAPQAGRMDRLRVASVLAHARLVGVVDEQRLHLRTSAPWTVAPLGERLPDLVVLPASIEPWMWMFPAAGRQPIWQNESVAVYAPNGALPRITPPSTVPAASPVSVRVTEASLERKRVVFTATYTKHASESWTGQDWVMVAVDDGPWPIPARFTDQDRGPEVAKWFAGLISPASAASSHTYALNMATASLTVRDESGVSVPLAASEGELGAGSWVLALRLQHEWRPNSWREAAFIPVILVRTSEAGDVAFEVHKDMLDVGLPRKKLAQ